MRWQKRARLVIGGFAVVFALVVAWQFKPRKVAVQQPPPARVDPKAVVESTGGRLERVNQSHEAFNLTYKRQLNYANGSAKMFDVSIVADRRDKPGTFTATSKEATVGPDANTIELHGDVRLESADLHATTEHATYDKHDDIVRASGAVELAEGRTDAKGMGMTYDRRGDLLVILGNAAVQMAADEGGTPTSITAGTATFARGQHYRKFERQVRLQRGSQVIESEQLIAHLSEDDSRIETVELRGGARINAANPAEGALQSLAGTDVNLAYAANGEALQHIGVSGNAAIQFAGAAGKPGRSITAQSLDVTLAPDGSTPTALTGRDGVLLTMPGEPGVAARTVQATALTAKGEAGKGLTRAQFTGAVQYRERGGPHDAAANSNALDVTMKNGMGEIEEARFAQSVKFVQGTMTANAAAARYDVDRGTLALSGSEPGALVPRVVNDRIAVDATTIDVVLDGPKVKAAGTPVKSVLQPAKKGDPAAADRRMPSMLKQDQPVNVTAESLDYDGTASTALYSGGAQLWQGDTSIKGDTISIDDKTGDMLSSGNVSTMTMLEQTDKEKKTKERVRSAGQGDDLKYEDEIRRLTYTGKAHLSGPEGDMTAKKIELYLKPSGDELDRAEGYEDVTLREQNRKTTGSRMTYTTADDRYVVVGTPVKIIDQCERETTGRTLTFVKSTDTVLVDGNQQTRTQTKGGKCP